MKFNKYKEYPNEKSFIHIRDIIDSVYEISLKGIRLPIAIVEYNFVQSKPIIFIFRPFHTDLKIWPKKTIGYTRMLSTFP